LALRGIPAEREVRVPITYKDLVFDEEIRLDVLVDRCLVIEIKAVEAVLPIHLAQTLSYMRLLNVPIGIIVNFHEPVLKQGIRRLTLRGADQP
jgi:GxxExxY protein